MLSMMQAHHALEVTPTEFHFPDFFSPILRVDYTVDDHLVAFGMLRPGRLKPDFAFDLTGKRIPIRGRPNDYIFKVLMKHNGYAYVNCYEDEEVFIRRVPLSELERFLANKNHQ
ncbi:hypothetical protein [Acanthopleuribacter pedis]|uniref:Uncharacterized protein n=1 Tax=Acanthopleuribacter pedis TaxID=442870 RepID=A0A8J7QBQ9_9BACT|nr:hypothetical protein [Acanthopleuribacter pedis]MBO1322681.1 hypothetical protein [Acanthopleuribacter pedis]